jgi:hypothetical protein
MSNRTGAAKVLYAFVVMAFLLCWLDQTSISQYCQQRYHNDCEIPLVGQRPAWQFGAQLTQALEDARAAFVASLDGAESSQRNAASLSVPVAASTTAPVGIAVAAPITVPVPASTATRPATQAPVSAPAAITLVSGDKVFFVGDSMMQGVAPHMANTLHKNFNIDSIDLSRQSTGLAYPSFFNWPQTVEKTLRTDPKIRLMVVFLGPNDPWDMPDGKGRPFLRFETPDWEIAYRQRIDSILDAAQAHAVQVIWVGPPNMFKDRLSTGMAYLRDIYASEIQRYQQHYLSANDILGYQTSDFSYYLPGDEGKKVKIRVDDGIHFTPTGQRMIADGVLSLISFPAASN